MTRGCFGTISRPISSRDMQFYHRALLLEYAPNLDPKDSIPKSIHWRIFTSCTVGPACPFSNEQIQLCDGDLTQRGIERVQAQNSKIREDHPKGSLEAKRTTSTRPLSTSFLIEADVTTPACFRRKHRHLYPNSTRCQSKSAAHPQVSPSKQRLTSTNCALGPSFCFQSPI
jgi:hypothetical protein